MLKILEVADSIIAHIHSVLFNVISVFCLGCLMMFKNYRTEVNIITFKVCLKNTFMFFLMYSYIFMAINYLFVK